MSCSMRATETGCLELSNNSSGVETGLKDKKNPSCAYRLACCEEFEGGLPDVYGATSISSGDAFGAGVGPALWQRVRRKQSAPIKRGS